MERRKNMKIFQWVVALILVAYAAYSVYHIFKITKEDRENSAQFLKLHPDAKLFTKGTMQSILLIMLSVVGFVTAFAVKDFGNDAQQTLFVQVTYFSVGIVFACLASEVRLKRKVYVGETNFYCVGNTYKYRNVKKIENVSGIFKKKEILMHDGEVLSLPVPLGQEIETALKDWKINKKRK